MGPGNEASLFSYMNVISCDIGAIQSQKEVGRAKKGRSSRGESERKMGKGRTGMNRERYLSI